MQSAEHFALWIVLLLSAAHGAMDKNIENIIVPLLPGQVAIKDWGIFHLTPTMDVIHKVLDDYVEAGMIEYKIDDNGIYIITIINCRKYQYPSDATLKIGYIRLYSSILEKQHIMYTCKRLLLWVVVLLRVNHEASSCILHGKRRYLQPGECKLGSIELANKIPISTSTISATLARFEEYEMIEYDPSSQGSRVRVINWTKYQLQHDQDTGNTPEATRKHPGNTPEVPRKHPGTNNNKNENNTDNDVYIYSTTFNAISKVLNLGGKPPTPKQQDFIDKWIGEYMFSDDIIICAFNRAKDNGITNVNFKYVDTILDNWHKAGVRTIKDIEKADQEYKEKKKTSKKINNTYYKKNSFTDFTQATTEDFYKAYDENLGYTNEAVPSLQEIMELEESIRARKEKN